MPISEISHQSKVIYEKQYSRNETVTEIKIDDPRHSSREGASAAQDIALNFVEFSSSTLSTSNTVNEETNTDDTYQRPIPPELLKNKMLLEKIFGIEVQENMEELAQSIVRLQASQGNPSASNNSASKELAISALGGTFAADSDLVIVETITDSQALNFSSSGIYNINDKTFHSTFELQLSEQRVSSTQSTVAAESLKDPLLVQFGSQSIGQLNGQSSDIDINWDGAIDSLPMFDGDVGYLVHDKNNNGKADNGSELFGPQSGSGFTDLSALDSNNNGFIDREDDEFSRLKLWQIDSNGNENWLSLSDTNIEAISLNNTATPFNFYDENDRLQAQLTQSSVAITDKGISYGVHQVDVRI